MKKLTTRICLTCAFLVFALTSFAQETVTQITREVKYKDCTLSMRYDLNHSRLFIRILQEDELKEIHNAPIKSELSNAAVDVYINELVKNKEIDSLQSKIIRSIPLERRKLICKRTFRGIQFQPYLSIEGNFKTVDFSTAIKLNEKNKIEELWHEVNSLLTYEDIYNIGIVLRSYKLSPAKKMLNHISPVFAISFWCTKEDMQKSITSQE
ncbi:MAG: hypothetical protein RR386_09010 [Bacteroidaceae bacterium]